MLKVLIYPDLTSEDLKILFLSKALVCFLLFGTPSVAIKDVSSDSTEDDAYAEIGKRGIGYHRNLQIGMFQPLICEGFYRRDKIRRARNVLHGRRHSQLGFFTPIYCKHFQHWANSHHNHGICSRRNSDCYEILHCYKKHGKKARSGVYWIKPKYYKPIRVYCDMHTDRGGWTVFQRRKDGSENFYRTWSEYKKGFGKLYGEFWLGNDNIHAIVSQGNYALRMDLQDHAGNKPYALYNNFNIGNERHKYKLSIGSYSGNAKDCLRYHNNAYFSTKDRDNDSDSVNCAAKFKGGWWYKGCFHCNLNGLYSKNKTTDTRYNLMYYWPYGRTNMKTSQLAIRWKRKFNH